MFRYDRLNDFEKACWDKSRLDAITEIKNRIKNWNYQKMLADQLVVLGKIEQELKEMEEEKI